MKIEDLAALMKKTKKETEEMLKENDVIELKLTEKNSQKAREVGEVKIVN